MKYVLGGLTLFLSSERAEQRVNQLKSAFKCLKNAQSAANHESEYSYGIRF